MKYLILAMLVGCTPEVQLPPKCHFGDVATVLNTSFYAGCTGVVVAQKVAAAHYVAFQERPIETASVYGLDHIKCPKIALVDSMRWFHEADLSCTSK